MTIPFFNILTQPACTFGRKFTPYVDDPLVNEYFLTHNLLCCFTSAKPSLSYSSTCLIFWDNIILYQNQYVQLLPVKFKMADFQMTEEQAAQIFDSFDKDRNGVMSIWEFQQFYQMVGSGYVGSLPFRQVFISTAHSLLSMRSTLSLVDIFSG